MKGAFTGAFQERTGRFEAAHGGSLFLDEIGDISPAARIRLLRVLETKYVEGRQPSRAQGRCTRPCATNKRLGDGVGAGRFRSDLYYRLNVAVIERTSAPRTAGGIPLLAAISWTSLGIVRGEGQGRSAPRPWRCSCTMARRGTA